MSKKLGQSKKNDMLSQEIRRWGLAVDNYRLEAKRYCKNLKRFVKKEKPNEVELRRIFGRFRKFYFFL